MKLGHLAKYKPVIERETRISFRINSASANSERGGTLTAAAILSLIASLISFDIGVSDARFYFFYVKYDLRITIPEVYLIVGIWGLAAFALGFAGGIFALKRRHLYALFTGFLSMIGLGFSLIAHWYTGEFFGQVAFFLQGIPLISLCSLGILLAWLRKAEFSNAPLSN